MGRCPSILKYAIRLTSAGRWPMVSDSLFDIMEATMASKNQKDLSAVESSAETLDNKTYVKELKRLHVELVKLQQWVVHKGLKVCIAFEGRDGAPARVGRTRPSPRA